MATSTAKWGSVTRAVAVDRPGFGLSYPALVARKRFSRRSGWSSSTGSSTRSGCKQPCSPATQWAAPGHSGTRSNTLTAYAGSSSSEHRHSCPVPHASARANARDTSPRRSAIPSENKREDDHALHVRNGGKGHDRSLPRPPRSARRGRQPRRPPRRDHATWLPTTATTAPRRAAATPPIPGQSDRARPPGMTCTLSADLSSATCVLAASPDLR